MEGDLLTKKSLASESILNAVYDEQNRLIRTSAQAGEGGTPSTPTTPPEGENPIAVLENQDGERIEIQVEYYNSYPYDLVFDC